MFLPTLKEECPPLSKAGNIRIKIHWPIEGEIKTYPLGRRPSRDWTVSLSFEVEKEPAASKEDSVLSNGQTIPILDFSEKRKNIWPRHSNQGSQCSRKYFGSPIR